MRFKLLILDKDPAESVKIMDDHLLGEMGLHVTNLVGYLFARFDKGVRGRLWSVDGHRHTLEGMTGAINWISRNTASIKWAVDLQKALMEEYQFRFEEAHPCSKWVENFSDISNFRLYYSEDLFVLPSVPLDNLVPTEYYISSKGIKCKPQRSSSLSLHIEYSPKVDVIETYKSYYKEVMLKHNSRFTKRERTIPWYHQPSQDGMALTNIPNPYVEGLARPVARRAVRGALDDNF